MTKQSVSVANYNLATKINRLHAGKIKRTFRGRGNEEEYS